MREKIIFLLFLLCLAKLYHIADRRMNFSLDLLINSFSLNAGERSSLEPFAGDVIKIKDYFLIKKVSEYKLSEDILKNCPRCSQRIIEFIYPVKFNQNSAFLIAYKNEEKQKNCKIVSFTESYNIYECK
jgi:hypothetical protein